MFKQLRTSLRCCQKQIDNSYTLARVSKPLRKRIDKLDLNQFKDCKDEDFLSLILNELELNYSIGTLLENEKFNYFKANFDHRINDIQNQLILNNQTFDYYPSENTWCLIANHVYCLTRMQKTPSNKEISRISGYARKSLNRKTTNKATNLIFQESEMNFYECDDKHADHVWKKLEEKNWLIYEVVKSNGYKSILYLNEHSKQLVLGVQGFKFNLKSYFVENHTAYVNSLRNLVFKSIHSLVCQLDRAIKMSRLLEYSFSITSYSLGSVLADLCVYLCHQYFNFYQVKSVTFAPIGSLKLLRCLRDSFESNKIDDSTPVNLDNLDIEAYLEDANFVNTCEEHLGRLVFLSLQGIQFNPELHHFKRIKQLNGSFFSNGFKSLDSLHLKSLLALLTKRKLVSRIADRWHVHSTVNESFQLIKENQTKTHNLIDKEVYDLTTNYILEMFKSVFHTTYELKIQRPISPVSPPTHDYRLIYNNTRVLYASKSEVEAILLVLSLTDLSRRDDLIGKQLLGLQKLYRVKYNLKDDQFYLMSDMNDFEIRNVDKRVRRLLEVYPKLGEQFDLSEQFIKFVKSVHMNRSHLLQAIDLHNYIEVDCDINEMRVVLLAAQAGNGKRTFSLRHIQKRLYKETNLVVRLINAASPNHILYDLYEFARELQLDAFDCVSVFLRLKEELNRRREFQFLLCFFNIQDFEFIRDFYHGLKANTKLILTSDKMYLSSYYDIMPINFHNVNRNDFLNLLARYESHLKELENEENFGTLSDLLDKLDGKNFLKLKTALCILAKGKIDSFRDFIRIYENVIRYVRESNEKAFKLLEYCALLDANHLDLDVLKLVYSSVYPHTEASECIDIIDYLTQMAILVESGKEKFKLHELYQSNLLANIDNLKKIEILNVVVPKLFSSRLSSELLYKHAFKLFSSEIEVSDLNTLNFKLDDILVILMNTEPKLYNYIQNSAPFVRLRRAIKLIKPKRNEKMLASIREETKPGDLDVIAKDFAETTRYLCNADHLQTQDLLDLLDRKKEIKGRVGEGKTTLCVRHALKRLNKEDHLVVKFLDGSSIHLLQVDIHKFFLELNIKRNAKINMFQQLKDELIKLNLISNHKFLLVIDNLKESCLAGDMLKSENTSVLFAYEREDESDFSRIPRGDYLSLVYKNINEIDQMLKTNNQNEFKNYINDFFSRHQISFSTVNSFIRVALNHKSEWSRQDLEEFYSDKYGYIKMKNNEAYVLLSYLAPLNGDYLSCSLIENIAKLAYISKLEYTLNYLVGLDILTQVDEKRFKFSRLVQQELKDYFSFVPNLRSLLLVLRSFEELIKNTDEWCLLNFDIEVCFKQLLYLLSSSDRVFITEFAKAELNTLTRLLKSIDADLLDYKENKNKFEATRHQLLDKHDRGFKEVNLQKLLAYMKQAINQLEGGDIILEKEFESMKIIIQQRCNTLKQKLSNNSPEQEAATCMNLIDAKGEKLITAFEEYKNECLSNFFNRDDLRKELLIETRKLNNKLQFLSEIFKKRKDEYEIYGANVIIDRMDSFFKTDLSKRISKFIYFKGEPILSNFDCKNLDIGEMILETN